MDADTILGQPTRSFKVNLPRLDTNQVGILGGNPSVASYGHSINTSDYTDLSLCQYSVLAPLAGSIVDGSITNESKVIENEGP